MSATLQFFATAPRGLEELLAAELAALGAAAIKLQPSGVLFQGPLQVGYRACLWSRVAGRVLLELGRGPASDAEELYAAALAIDWARHMDRTATLAVDFTGTNAAIVHTTFGAQKVKDAVVDQLRAGTQRPSVDKLRPDLRIHVHLRKRTGPPGQAREGGRDEAVLSIDLSGESLHRRGYREEGAMAPLKENLAAAVLLRAGWPAIAAAGGPLLDPMCGSGTLLIEGAWMAGDRAPGLGREHFGFLGWRGHEPAIWAELVAEASARAAAGAAKIPDIRGYDTSGLAIAAAHRNIEQAGLRRVVHVERFALGEQLLAPAPKDRPEGASVGLVVCNPPYGARVGEGEDLRPLYRELGELLKTRHMGGAAAVLLEDRELGHAIGLRARKIYDLYNGALPVHLLLFKLEEAAIQRPRVDRPQVRSEAAEAFANRLAKNRKQLAPWAAREQISCYRVYDQDIPDYAVAVDVYGEHAHVQEYAAPKEIEAERAESRLRDVMAVVPEVLGIPRDQVHLKIRERSRGGSQYGKQAATGKLLEVREGPARFFVNLTDYLDTGLFLDHRLTRAGRAAGEGPSLPQPVRVHRLGDGARGEGRGAGDDDGRHVTDLHGVGAQELRPERDHGAGAPTDHGRVPGLDGAGAAPLRAHLPRPADLLEFEADGGQLRSAARPRAADPRGRAPARARGDPGVLEQQPPLSPRRRGARRAGDHGHHARDDPAGLRPQPADPPVLADRAPGLKLAPGTGCGQAVIRACRPRAGRPGRGGPGRGWPRCGPRRGGRARTGPARAARRAGSRAGSAGSRGRAARRRRGPGAGSGPAPCGRRRSSRAR
nr:bifunctional 23S rRNA (guanine(2069)-N(7))-methyltransferase RlmK/23S rRNA (guanine(2445)-N(2))-methyltransferase RlmL [Nannocystis sp.]